MPVLETIGLVGSIGSAIGGALGGSSDARRLRRLQEEQLRLTNEQFDLAEEDLLAGEDLVIQNIDEANAILAGVEPAILAGLDEDLRIRVAQQAIRQEQESARLRRQQAMAGLDATTVAQGQQRQLAYGQADAVGALTANYATARANAIASSRGAQASGLMSRAGAIGDFASARANLHTNRAGFLGGVQFQGGNSAAGIGAAAGSIFGAITDYSRAREQDRFRNQLQAGTAFLPVSGGPTGRRATINPLENIRF